MYTIYYIIYSRIQEDEINPNYFSIKITRNLQIRISINMRDIKRILNRFCLYILHRATLNETDTIRSFQRRHLIH